VGPSQTITFVVTLDDPLPDGVESITNIAQIGDDGTNGSDENPTDNEDEITTNVAAAPDLQLSKDDGGVTAAPGSDITYTLTYTNSGTQDASGVVITETLPSHTSFNASTSPSGWQQVGATDQYTYSVGSLAVGPSQTISFVVTVDNPLPAGVESITNVAQIGDDGLSGSDQEPTDNETELTTDLTAAPDLQLSKDDGGITATPGSDITYTLTYTNSGTQDASGVVITETLPTNTSFNASASPPGWQQAGTTNQYTYNVGNLDVGPSQTISFVVTVDDPLPAGVESVTNLARIGDDGTNRDEVELTTTVSSGIKLYLPIVLKNN
jgi:uncharacterized repeat protein (TIGR01451 family)